MGLLQKFLSPVTGLIEDIRSQIAVAKAINAKGQVGLSGALVGIVLAIIVLSVFYRIYDTIKAQFDGGTQALLTMVGIVVAAVMIIGLFSAFVRMR